MSLNKAFFFLMTTNYFLVVIKAFFFLMTTNYLTLSNEVFGLTPLEPQ